MLAPASGFYATEGLGNNEARIAYVLKIEDLKNEPIAIASGEVYGRKENKK